MYICLRAFERAGTRASVCLLYVCMSVCARMRTCVYACVCLSVYVHRCVCIFERSWLFIIFTSNFDVCLLACIRLRMRVCVRTETCLSICLSVCLYVCTYACVSGFLHACLYLWFFCLSVCMYVSARMCAWVYVCGGCVCVCVHAWIHVYVLLY